MQGVNAVTSAPQIAAGLVGIQESHHAVVDQTRVSPGLVFALGRVRTHHGSRAITMLAPFKRFTPLTAGLCVAGGVVFGSRATCCAIAPTDAREHSTSEFASRGNPVSGNPVSCSP